jgi:hypothetical protein
MGKKLAQLSVMCSSVHAHGSVKPILGTICELAWCCTFVFRSFHKGAAVFYGPFLPLLKGVLKCCSLKGKGKVLPAAEYLIKHAAMQAPVKICFA